MYLYDLPAQRKNVPDLIKDPVELIKDVRSLVERHCKDQTELAITGRSVLRRDLNRDNTVLTSRLQMDTREMDHHQLDADGNAIGGGNDNGDFATPQSVTKAVGSGAGAGKVYKRNGGINGAANVPRRRRRRCKTCAPCNSTECGHCTFCLDMVSALEKTFKSKKFCS